MRDEPALSLAAIAVPVPTKSTPIGFPLVIGTALTTSAAAAEWPSAPLVPVTVSVGLPAGVVPVVVTVNVAVPAPAMDAGENDAIALAGRPLTARLTALENPFSAPAVTV